MTDGRKNTTLSVGADASAATSAGSSLPAPSAASAVRCTHAWWATSGPCSSGTRGRGRSSRSAAASRSLRRPDEGKPSRRVEELECGDVGAWDSWSVAGCLTFGCGVSCSAHPCHLRGLTAMYACKGGTCPARCPATDPSGRHLGLHLLQDPLRAARTRRAVSVSAHTHHPERAGSAA